MTINILLETALKSNLKLNFCVFLSLATVDRARFKFSEFASDMLIPVGFEPFSQ